MDPVDFLTAHGGVAHRRTMLAAGVSKSALTRALADGRILRAHQKVYCLGTAGGVGVTRLAVLATGGVISHDAAAALHGIEMAHRPDSHVTVGRNRARVAHPGCFVHRSDLGPSEVMRVDGLPVTAPLRTVLDCARTLEPAEVVVIADSAVRQELVSFADLRHAAHEVRGRGAGRLRRVVDCCDPGSGSVLESALRMLLIEHGLKPPRTQYEMRAASGRHLATVDFAWPDLRVIVEADGFAYHRGRKAYLRDRTLGNACTLAGWRLLRFSWEDVFQHPAYVLRSTQRVLHLAAEATRPPGR
ncbi:type IV toxin-antitoxin system AbiEi family antitoxin domain-containing protein [Actinoallomurus vinaceus]|uniref:Type IV toxin-antitoxin system AbiEi family antitoxin domain-containing protein n=1 Tax=Actinoallomurus vinaceus TaxID=1080074 RepID=A0ABP8UBI1_9ACTN